MKVAPIAAEVITFPLRVLTVRVTLSFWGKLSTELADLTYV